MTGSYNSSPELQPYTAVPVLRAVHGFEHHLPPAQDYLCSSCQRLSLSKILAVLRVLAHKASAVCWLSAHGAAPDVPYLAGTDFLQVLIGSRGLHRRCEDASLVPAL